MQLIVNAEIDDCYHMYYTEDRCPPPGHVPQLKSIIANHWPQLCRSIIPVKSSIKFAEKMVV